MPSTLTMRLTRSRSPSSSLMAARMLRPVSNANARRPVRPRNRGRACRRAADCPAHPGPCRQNKAGSRYAQRSHSCPPVSWASRARCRAPSIAARPSCPSLSQSAFTRSRKARISSIDFTPRLDSTPEETSTAAAPVTRTASATLSGVRPPARNQGSGTVSVARGSSSRTPCRCRRAGSRRRHRTSAGRPPTHRQRYRVRHPRRRDLDRLHDGLAGAQLRSSATRAGVSAP